MITEKTVEVKEGGVRLDAAILSLFPSSTRAVVRDAMGDGAVLGNGRRA